MTVGRDGLGWVPAAAKEGQEMTGLRSPLCRCGLAGASTVLSRHLTSEGLVVYSLCGCGSVEMRLVPYHPDGPARSARSRPHGPVTGRFNGDPAARG